jgi:hypothetical protein
MIKESDFSRCTFNPMFPGPLFEEYPALQILFDGKENWLDLPNVEQIVRWVIMCYDSLSPMIVLHKDLNERRKVAFQMVGIETNTELCLQLSTHTHEFAPEIIFRYLKEFVKNREFARLAAVEYKYWESIWHLLKPVSGDNSKVELEAMQKKSLLAAEIDKDIERLDKYFQQFFGHDKELIERMQSKKVKRLGSPESQMMNV